MLNEKEIPKRDFNFTEFRDSCQCFEHSVCLGKVFFFSAPLLFKQFWKTHNCNQLIAKCPILNARFLLVLGLMRLLGKTEIAARWSWYGKGTWGKRNFWIAFHYPIFLNHILIPCYFRGVYSVPFFVHLLSSWKQFRGDIVVVVVSPPSNSQYYFPPHPTRIEWRMIWSFR